MRRKITVVVLLALMAGFGLGVNRLLAGAKSKIPSEASVSIPSETRPALVLPGTLYLAQNGDIFRLSQGYFTDLHLSTASGAWTQPASVPGSLDLVAVMRATEYSDLYVLDSNGGVLRQLSNNATKKVNRVWQNHWMFWPRVAPDGDTIYFSYDEPKDSSTYAVDFAVWSGSLGGKLAGKEVSVPFAFTGGDVEPVPMANGAVLYSKYAIGTGNAYSALAIQTRPLASPVDLTGAAQDCGQPALSPDGIALAMVCTGGTGLQSTRLEVASLHGTTLGAPRILVDNCLCSAPSWAPDGSGLVYYAPADATGHFELWWISGAAGAAPHPARQVTTSVDFDATSPPAWSPLTSVPSGPR